MPAGQHAVGITPPDRAVGAQEVLFDDAHRFTQAASAARVSIRLDIYGGMPHVFHATTLSVAATLLRRTEWLSRLPSALQ